MLVTESQLAKIKKIILRGYKNLAISTIGNAVFSADELAAMRLIGVDTKNPQSFLTLVLLHNYLNAPIKADSPKSIFEMVAQQAGLTPKGLSMQLIADALNGKMKEYVEAVGNDISTRVLGMMRESNAKVALDNMRDLDEKGVAKIFHEGSTPQKIRQQLQDLSGNANRDWQRVVLTEMSNAIGHGAVAKLVEVNKDVPLDEIIVYRVTVPDAVTCQKCRQFYGHQSIPKLYRLSTLIANGSNYGRKQADLLPVAGATHPNTRTSQPLQLRPGWALDSSGIPQFIGREKWPDFVKEHLVG